MWFQPWVMACTNAMPRGPHPLFCCLVRPHVSMSIPTQTATATHIHMPIIPMIIAVPTGAHIITVMHNSMRRSIAMRAAVLQVYMSLHMTRIPMIPANGTFLNRNFLHL